MTTCEICGEPFEATRSDRRYCSACGKDPERARRRMEKAVYQNKIHAGDLHTPKDRVCNECGRHFTSIYNRSFCSHECSIKHQAKTARCPVCNSLLIEKGITSARGLCSDECREKRRMEKAITDGNYVGCEKCGKMFIRKDYNNRFCSKACYQEWTAEKNKGRLLGDAGSRVKRKETRICEGCGSPFAWRIESSGQRFCSKLCREEKNKNDKIKSVEPLNVGKDLNICTICKTPQSECERFTSGFTQYPVGVRMKRINEKPVIVTCPKYRPYTEEKKGDEKG